MSAFPLVPLRAVTLDAQTGPFGSQLHFDEYVDDGIPVINPSNIVNSKIVPDPTVTITKETSERLARHRLEPGDLVFARRGELGRAAVAHNEAAGWLCGTGSLRVRTRQSAFDSRFAEYVLQSASTRAYFEMYAVGSTMGNLNTSIVLGLSIPLPPLDEQRRIADLLDVETARIDALVDQKRRVIALIDERVQAVVNIITPGAVVSGVDGRPIGIAGMQCVRLGAIAEIHGGFAMDAGRDTNGDSVTLPYLRVANVQDGALALDDVKKVTLPRALARRCTLRSGDVLMTEGGDPDKLGRGTVWSGDIEPCLHQNAIFAVRPKPQLLPEYLALVTRTRYARAYFEITASKATGIAHTSSTKITSFRIPMRTIAGQRQNILDIQEALARIDALRTPAEQQLALLAERRQALITAAVTGGITV